MRKFEVLSPEMTAKIEYENKTGTYARVGFDNANVIRRRNVAKDNDIVWRPPFVHDIDKINGHPTVLGMTQICEQVIEKL